jgi:hypothetical protein
MHIFKAALINLQIIAGAKNIYRYENPLAVQERKVLKLIKYTDPSLDLYIIKVNVPFQFTAAVQPVTLAPTTFNPPGKKHFFQEQF